MMVEHSLDLEPGAHVMLDDGQAVYAIVVRRLDAASPSGVAFRLMPDAGGWIDAGRVTYAPGYDEHGTFDPDTDPYGDME